MLPNRSAELLDRDSVRREDEPIEEDDSVEEVPPPLELDLLLDRDWYISKLGTDGLASVLVLVVDGKAIPEGESEGRVLGAKFGLFGVGIVDGGGDDSEGRGESEEEVLDASQSARSSCVASLRSVMVPFDRLNVGSLAADKRGACGIASSVSALGVDSSLGSKAPEKGGGLRSSEPSEGGLVDVAADLVKKPGAGIGKRSDRPSLLDGATALLTLRLNRRRPVWLGSRAGGCSSELLILSGLARSSGDRYGCMLELP